MAQVQLRIDAVEPGRTEQRGVKQLAKSEPRKTSTLSPPSITKGTTFRFSPTRLAHRKRLDITVADLAFLLNTSSVSIYKCENG
jgi:hypothetical protein